LNYQLIAVEWKKSFTTDQKILCFSFLLLFHRWFFSRFLKKKHLDIFRIVHFQGSEIMFLFLNISMGDVGYTPHQKLLTVFESCGQKSKLNFLWCKILVNYSHFHFHFLIPLPFNASKDKKNLQFKNLKWCFLNNKFF
jgi:hypothetical protein